MYLLLKRFIFDSDTLVWTAVSVKSETAGNITDTFFSSTKLETIITYLLK